jgi:hypothetical protein
MEPRFDFDFSRVRIHTDDWAAQMNRRLSARAFTYGQDIYFAAGQSPANYPLLAHELTHVVQQAGGATSGQAQVMRQSEADSMNESAQDAIDQAPGDGAVALNQGQADGRNIQEACKLAKEDCKSTLDCPPERMDIDKKCTCWKGGEFGLEGGYTCTTQCRCKVAPIPIS